MVAIKGNFLLGLNFLVVRLYPMRPGATMMSSFLVNVALILAMSSAVTQFCAQAFASYASNTIIFEIFGNDVRRAAGAWETYVPPPPPPPLLARARGAASAHPPTHPQVLYLKGLRYIYQFNVFLYMMLSIAGLSLLWMVVRGAGGPWRRKKAEDAYKA